MAFTHIALESPPRLGHKLRLAIEGGRTFLDALASLKAVMDTCVDGAIYTEIEVQFGLPVGQGQAAYNLTAGALAAVDVAAVKDFLNRIG